MHVVLKFNIGSTSLWDSWDFYKLTELIVVFSSDLILHLVFVLFALSDSAGNTFVC